MLTINLHNIVKKSLLQKLQLCRENTLDATRLISKAQVSKQRQKIYDGQICHKFSFHSMDPHIFMLRYIGTHQVKNIKLVIAYKSKLRICIQNYEYCSDLCLDCSYYGQQLLFQYSNWLCGENNKKQLYSWSILSWIKLPMISSDNQCKVE